MKVLLSILLVYLSIYTANAAMSDAQMKAALKMMRNVCQPKNKATDENIDGLKKGNWDTDRSVKCYLWCILNMYRLITKENKFDWENGLVTINTQAPESIRATAAKSVQACKDAVKTTTDKCEAAYEITHCMYLDDPQHYFLP